MVRIGVEGRPAGNIAKFQIMSLSSGGDIGKRANDWFAIRIGFAAGLTLGWTEMEVIDEVKTEEE